MLSNGQEREKDARTGEERGRALSSLWRQGERSATFLLSYITLSTYFSFVFLGQIESSRTGESSFVCFLKASGNHYGVPFCDGCCGFFVWLLSTMLLQITCVKR